MLVHRIKTYSELKDYNYCYCDYCGKVISFWIANLPLFNYIYLRGNTACCKQPIKRYHPISELFGGLAIFIIFVGVLA